MSSHRHYHNPERETYESATGAFGSVQQTKSYLGPKGKKGIVRDIEVFLTADAVGSTSVPEIVVGAATGQSQYARFRLGTTATVGYTAASPPRRARNLVTGNPTPPVLNDFAGHIALETAEIPADAAFVISSVIGVGTPAGTGYYRVVVDWY
jgi:hypothetical protein